MYAWWPAVASATLQRHMWLPTSYSYVELVGRLWPMILAPETGPRFEPPWVAEHGMALVGPEWHFICPRTGPGVILQECQCLYNNAYILLQIPLLRILFTPMPHVFNSHFPRYGILSLFPWLSAAWVKIYLVVFMDPLLLTPSLTMYCAKL